MHQRDDDEIERKPRRVEQRDDSAAAEERAQLRDVAQRVVIDASGGPRPPARSMLVSARGESLRSSDRPAQASARARTVSMK